MIIIKKFRLKTRTNNKELAKTYFTVVEDETLDDSLIIRKLVLSKDVDLYSNTSVIIKYFKDYYLFQQIFSIKLDTLKKVNEIIF